MLKLKVIEKGVKLAEKLYKKEYNEKAAVTAYLEVSSVEYDFYDGGGVEVKINWGQEDSDYNHGEAIICLPSYIKTAGQVAWYVVGYVIAKEF